MTTARDVKKLVKPIREKYPEFVLHERFLFQTPTRHLLKGLIITSCRSKENFDVMYIIEAPFVTTYGWNYGHKTMIFHGEFRWNLTIPNIEFAVLDAFERKILPLLNRVSDLEEFDAFMHHWDRYNNFNDGGIEALLTKIALGDLDRATKLAEKEIAELTELDDRLSETGRKILAHTKQVQAMLLRGDKSEMAKHLHELERNCLERLKFTKFHERTPFPLELP